MQHNNTTRIKIFKSMIDEWNKLIKRFTKERNFKKVEQCQKAIDKLMNEL